MPRHKEYDREDVIKSITRLFWERGYTATSMSAIVTKSGLNSASLYKEFGDKESLFQVCLAYFYEKGYQPFIQPLIHTPNITGIQQFLNRAVKNVHSEEFKGCLLVNALDNRRTISDQSVKLAETYFEKMQLYLEKAIINSQSSGEIPTQKDPKLLANHVICMIKGIAIHGQSQNNKRHAQGIVDLVAHSLTAE